MIAAELAKRLGVEEVSVIGRDIEEATSGEVYVAGRLLNKLPRKLLKEKYGFAVADEWVEHIQKSAVRISTGGSGSLLACRLVDVAALARADPSWLERLLTRRREELSGIETSVGSAGGRVWFRDEADGKVVVYSMEERERIKIVDYEGSKQVERTKIDEKLKELEWMVGHWTSTDPAIHADLDCHWTKNQNFLTRAIKVSAGDLEFSGMQIIGWDPAAKTIRSWTFDSDGGFAEATWSLQKDRWLIHNKGVLSDGRKASAVNILKPVDADSFTWQATERTAGGGLLPNVDEVLIGRQ